jgi:hypothetical protein
MRLKVGFNIVDKVGIDVLLQFLFSVVHFGVNVGSYVVFKVLVASVVHG